MSTYMEFNLANMILMIFFSSLHLPCDVLSYVLSLVSLIFLVQKFCLIFTWCIFINQCNRSLSSSLHSSVHSVLVNSLIALLFIASICHYMPLFPNNLKRKQKFRNTLGKEKSWGTAFATSYFQRQWLVCGLHFWWAQICNLQEPTHLLLLVLQEPAESVLGLTPRPVKNPNGKWGV